MDKETGAKLIALAVAMDQPISEMFTAIESIEDYETKGRFKHAVGELMGAIARDIIFPIEAVFPDLIPDKR